MQAKRHIEKMLPPAKVKHLCDDLPVEPVHTLSSHTPSSPLNAQDRLVERALNMPFPLSHDLFQFNLDNLLDESVYITQLATYFPKLDRGDIDAEEYSILANAIAVLQRQHKDPFIPTTPVEEPPICSPTNVTVSPSTLTRLARVAINTLITPQCLWKALTW